MSAAAHAAEHHDEHHGPPVPHYSSRIKPETLGMYLFIASEIMLFGSFFTAYFFVRIVNGVPWPTAPYHLPVFVAGVNTVIGPSSVTAFCGCDSLVMIASSAGPVSATSPYLPANALAGYIASGYLFTAYGTTGDITVNF